jgi:hypothetical protein
MSNALSNWIGRWWVCLTFEVIATIKLGYLVLNAVYVVTENRTLLRSTLDEYYLNWTASDARPFFTALGAAGRAAYQNYYLTLDFCFPVLSLIRYILITALPVLALVGFWFKRKPLPNHEASS